MMISLSPSPHSERSACFSLFQDASDSFHYWSLDASFDLVAHACLCVLKPITLAHAHARRKHRSAGTVKSDGTCCYVFSRAVWVVQHAGERAIAKVFRFRSRVRGRHWRWRTRMQFRHDSRGATLHMAASPASTLPAIRLPHRNGVTSVEAIKMRTRTAVARVFSRCCCCCCLRDLLSLHLRQRLHV